MDDIVTANSVTNSIDPTDILVLAASPHRGLRLPSPPEITELFLRRRFRSAHQQHRHRRRANDVLRVAPHGETTNAPTSMGSDHNQIGRPLFRILDDRGT